MTDLSGHIALVTGASKGIGQASAVALAEAGADVIVHYHQNREGAETTRAQIEKLGSRAFITQADVSVADQVASMHAQVNRGFSAPDILVNNAGLAQRKEVD
jgi:NAD(P)-dependent dehydrogenase (short-subunit alcohol dehydrogenase family)